MYLLYRANARCPFCCPWYFFFFSFFFFLLFYFVKIPTTVYCCIHRRGGKSTAVDEFQAKCLPDVDEYVFWQHQQWACAFSFYIVLFFYFKNVRKILRTTGGGERAVQSMHSRHGRVHEGATPAAPPSEAHHPQQNPSTARPFSVGSAGAAARGEFSMIVRCCVCFLVCLGFCRVFFWEVTSSAVGVAVRWKSSFRYVHMSFWPEDVGNWSSSPQNESELSPRSTQSCFPLLEGLLEGPSCSKSPSALFRSNWVKYDYYPQSNSKKRFFRSDGRL